MIASAGGYVRKVLRSGTWLISVGVILVFLTACMNSEASSPEEVYVAPSGSDSAAGTRDAPLRTVQAGVNRLGPRGGVVELADGTYARQRVVLRDRDHVTVRAAAGAEPVLDATGLTPPDGESALVEIRGGSDVAVKGLILTGYRTRSTEKVPQGILVTGAASDVRIAGNHVHHLGNDNPTRSSFDIGANGIAVYGRDEERPIRGLKITDNEVDHLVLGASESVVVNGNIDAWEITGNYIHHNNNIGIDAIGYEETIGGPARYTDVNRARNGIIADNTVTDIVSKGNPSYWEDGGWCNCADGIYIDGGGSIEVKDNTVERADIGIEVAAENSRGKTNDVSVTSNNVTASKYVGLAIGGYDPRRGEAFDVRVSDNTFRGNNTLQDGSPEILLQYKVHETTLTHNVVTATNADYPLLVRRVRKVGTAAQNKHVVLNHNDYGAPSTAKEAVFVWLGQEKVGMQAWRNASGQDAASTLTTR
jgi:hypothetical protein